MVKYLILIVLRGEKRIYSTQCMMLIDHSNQPLRIITQKRKSSTHPRHLLEVTKKRIQVSISRMCSPNPKRKYEKHEKVKLKLSEVI